MRSLLSLFIFTLTFTSCDNYQSADNEGLKIKKKNLKEVAFPIKVGSYSFDECYKDRVFSGMISIPQAQSKTDWVIASENNKPAWCFADSIHQKGVLFNGYCLSEIANQDHFLLSDTTYQIWDAMEDPISTDFKSCDSLFLIERNANGNFYSIGYHSFWLRPESESGRFNIVSVDQFSRRVQVRSVNPGNGYFIRFLK